MKFHELVYLLKENTEEQYDSMVNWLEDNEGDISLEKFKEMVPILNLQYTHIIKNKIIEVTDGKDIVYLEFDLKYQDFDIWAWNKDEVVDKILNMSDYQILDLLGIEENDVYISGWECTIKDAQEYPGTVYHYTTEDKWEEIQSHKEMTQSHGTGLTNRNILGIFTSVDPEEHAIGTYGDICLSIDLANFKSSNSLSKLNLSPEPEVLENELHNCLIGKFRITDELEIDNSGGMSSLTMVVHHNIPLQFIKRVN